ncbi:MAG TPA: hypothetical protein VGS20_03265 [Candidatus Acidoferrales bacterium]|nr:hypothetical protein [Candidatus Acidoferrales bacterium]
MKRLTGSRLRLAWKAFATAVCVATLCQVAAPANGSVVTFRAARFALAREVAEKTKTPPTASRSQAAPAADGAVGRELFTGRRRFSSGAPACSGCHGIADLSAARGPTPGADLTHEYSTLGPDALDTILAEPPFSPMDVQYKKTPLTPGERQDLIAFLKQVDRVTAAAPRVTLTFEAIAAGEALFEGRVRTRNGGPACATCHAAAGIPFPFGGTLGPDLTRESSKLGPQGLRIALKTLYFPAMDPLFRNRPLTPTEQDQLAAFFQSINQQPPPASPAPALVAAAVAELVGLFLWTWLAVGRRRLRSVRLALLARAGRNR